MAFTEIEGTITRTFYQGKGAELTETFKKRDGSEGTKRWAMWFKDSHGLVEGDAGKFRGAHGDEVDEWTDKEGGIRHSVKRSLNDARPIEGGTRQSAPADTWAPAADTAAAAFPAPDLWNAPGNFSDETPF